MLVPLISFAQSGTNSPYSQYGLGILSEQSTGFNRGMNGVAMGMHQSNQLNYQNPASYAFIDSLTFIFDVGASLQVTNFQEGSRKINAQNANFDYATMAFRVAKNLGMSIGIMPYTNIGYSYNDYTAKKISDTNSTTITTTHSGSGGTRSLYAGLGWSPLKGLAIGANIGYFWGSYSRSVVNSFSDSYVSTANRYYSAELRSYDLDLGLQYDIRLGRNDVVTIGGTYKFGHHLGGSCDMKNISTNTQTGVSDTTATVLNKALYIPTTIRGGLAFRHGKSLYIGADYSLQKWGQYDYPNLEYVSEISSSIYTLTSGTMKDRHKIVVGGEYIPNPVSRNYFNRVHIRAGVGYATPYYYINGIEGPKEYSASIGLGLPITAAGGRSILNISGQWVQQNATGLIRENTFRINIGITFNERWFMKWKLE